ncbi:MAG: flagellin [Arcobacter sp.]|uniref:flagellin N-terminal helical domain-containing protein n=1 Tax=Arcobacter sp. TaxID=1872629 RepID=UPI003D04B0A2
MRINTNVSSLTAQEAAQNTSKSITGSLEKLSTGLRINKASDDASGLAIADKLRTQATSINQGIANGNSAVTLLQIADKSMAEQSNILDTIKAKLIQANTDTTSDDGRESIRKDINKLLEQLDNIAKQTNYNGTSLLQRSSTDQNASESLKFQIGETEKDIISNAAIRSNTEGLGGGGKVLIDADNATTGDKKNNTVLSNGTMEFKTVVTATGAAGTTNLNSRDAAGTADAAVSVQVSGQVGIIGGANDITISNMDDKTREALTLMAAVAGATNITAEANGDFTITGGESIDLKDLNVSNMQLDMAAGANGIQITTDKVVSVKNLDLSDNTLDLETAVTNTITGGELLSSLAALGQNELTKDMADKYQSVVDNAITDLNGYRGDIGSTQNQVESAVRNLMTQATNVKAAESIIRDVDYAQESANFNKQNIISQAGSYAISQANAVQQNVLRLLQ